VLDLFAWLVPIAPLLGALVCTLLSLRGDKEIAHIPAIAGLSLSALATICLLVLYGASESARVFEGYQFLKIGSEAVNVSLRIDSLSLTLLTVVTVVSALVCIYSREYMKGDPGYARYFAVFSAFVFAMTMLVMASNLLLLYAFWEGVGTCSYLLIGFWFRKPSAAAAATKAFLVNRVADVAFFIGILLLGVVVGQSSIGTNLSLLSRYEFDVVFRAAEEISRTNPSLLYWIGLCLIIGAIGKSAQFPFHVWLPDAMEGPTPVSALIHAATMVTAGVYLTARMAPVLIYTPDVLVLVGYLGAITSVIAAVMALFQDDLKRVLAYSTVSQLGYLFMALGAGSHSDYMGIAIFAAMFHLVTHAAFKALLFLSAGSVMHAMGDVIDMRRFSGLRKVLPRTHAMFAIGAATLAGLPLLSAFWSKDAILGLLVDAGQYEYGRQFKVIAVIGFITAFLTAIYTSKSYFRTFWGKEKLPEEAGHHPHDAGNMMFGPMVALAVGSVLIGAIFHFTHGLLSYLDLTPLPIAVEVEHATHWWVMLSSAAIACIGVGIGYVWSTMMSDEPSMKSEPNWFDGFAKERLYIDAIYHKVLVVPAQAIASASAWFDDVIVNGIASAIGLTPAGVGHSVKRLQSGKVTSYATYTAIGIAALAVYLIAF
jgi:NADH-quinone oxidoreductase subunit L